MRYAYVDETVFDNERYVGTGILLSKEPISNEIIQRAIEKLMLDPDFAEGDSLNIERNQNTVSKGYFHACDDSKDAHSHLLNEINKFEDVKFVCYFNERDDEKDSFLFDQTFYDNLTDVLCAEKMIFYVEQRGALDENKLNEKYQKYIDYVIKIAKADTWIPIYLPEVEFHIVDKSCAGVQCCDFLLWTSARKNKGEKTWSDRVNVQCKTEMKGIWKGDKYFFKTDPANYDCYYGPKHIPFALVENVDEKLCQNFFLFALKTCIDCLGDPKMYFLEKDLNYIKNFLTDETKQEEYLSIVLKTFVRIFDYIPVVDEQMSDKIKTKCLLAKKFCSCAMEKNKIFDCYANYRKNNLCNLENEVKNFSWESTK